MTKLYDSVEEALDRDHMLCQVNPGLGYQQDVRGQLSLKTRLYVWGDGGVHDEAECDALESDRKNCVCLPCVRERKTRAEQLKRNPMLPLVEMFDRIGRRDRGEEIT